MFTLLSIENPLFFGKQTYSMENLLIVDKISLCLILGN